ncbi:MAG: hypothetical protein JOZ57_14330 [Abitibacteriaceae bacterium]|nr:hypothetical protein [Abditibacteriaceae bacterium]
MARLTREKNEEAESNGAPPSVPVMTGTHFHALDEKGRIIIPAKLRPALTDHFWMILNDKDNIDLYDYQTGLDILRHCERQMAEHPEDEDIAAAVERITGAAEEVTVESGWRVQVPDILRFYGALDKEVVTVGALNHATLWSREKWDEAQTRRLESAEVRRAQAGMLRAAASSIRKAQTTAEPVVEMPEVVEERVQVGEQADVAATGTTGIAAVGGPVGSREPDTRTAPASTGDGKRGNRILTLSQLGR